MYAYESTFALLSQPFVYGNRDRYSNKAHG
jgi:hypothetical protein